MRWSLLGPVRLAWPTYSRNASCDHLKHVADSADLAPHRHEVQGLTRSAPADSADSAERADSVHASELAQALVGHEQHIPPTVFCPARALARHALHLTPIATAQARKAHDTLAS